MKQRNELELSSLCQGLAVLVFTLAVTELAQMTSREALYSSVILAEQRAKSSVQYLCRLRHVTLQGRPLMMSWVLVKGHYRHVYKHLGKAGQHCQITEQRMYLTGYQHRGKTGGQVNKTKLLV